MDVFLRALLSTAVPLVLISVGSSIGAAAIGSQDALAFGYLWVLGALVAFTALVLAIILVIAGQRRMAGGVVAGVGIGIASLGATCFANNALMNLW